MKSLRLARPCGPGTLAVLVVLVLAMATVAVRAGDDVFIVAPVEVDVTASSSLVAREQALERGETRAWKRLVERMVLAEQSAGLTGLGQEEVRALIHDYEILKERTSKVRYIAELSFGFRPDAVRNLMNDMGISFAETRSRPVLVIPVLSDGLHEMLWEDPNPWREAWQDFEPPDGLLPIVVPWGDLQDMRDLPVSAALGDDWAPLQLLAERYGAGDAVVALARAVPDGETTGLEVSLVRHGPGSGPETRADPVSVGSGDAFRAAVEQVVAVLEDDWKRANLVSRDARTSVAVLIPVEDSFRRWLAIRRQIESIGIVRDVIVRRLSRQAAVVDIVMVGDVDQLRTALRQRDLELHQGREQPVLTERSRQVPERYRPPAAGGPVVPRS